MDLKNKVVLVTGASKGIGLHLIKKLQELGATVIGIYNENPITCFGVDSYKCDIKNEEEIKSLFNYINNKYNQIDCVINGAAISKDADITEKTKEEFMSVLEVNLVGTFLICKYALEIMKSGVIINISSTNASTTYNPISIDYDASKAGVESLTKNLALRYPYIKICALAPNWVATESVLDMSPLYLASELKRVNQKRLLTKEEVCEKIIEIITNKEIKSGEIIKVGENFE